MAQRHRAGLACILVKYIGYYKKEKKGVRRNLEKVVLWFYTHSRRCKRAEYIMVENNS